MSGGYTISIKKGGYKILKSIFQEGSNLSVEVDGKTDALVWISWRRNYLRFEYNGLGIDWAQTLLIELCRRGFVNKWKHDSVDTWTYDEGDIQEFRPFAWYLDRQTGENIAIRLTKTVLAKIAGLQKKRNAYEQRVAEIMGDLRMT